MKIDENGLFDVKKVTWQEPYTYYDGNGNKVQVVPDVTTATSMNVEDICPACGDLAHLSNRGLCSGFCDDTIPKYIPKEQFKRYYDKVKDRLIL